MSSPCTLPGHVRGEGELALLEGRSLWLTNERQHQFGASLSPTNAQACRLSLVPSPIPGAKQCWSALAGYHLSEFAPRVPRSRTQGLPGTHSWLKIAFSFVI